MTDRGLPIVDGAPACPFVAFEDDRDGRALAPDHRHRCFAESKPAPRALAHQEAYCLASAFPVCPAFQDWARREAAAARPGLVEAPAPRDDSPPPTPMNVPLPPRDRDPRHPTGMDIPLPLPPRRNPARDWAAPPPWSADDPDRDPLGAPADDRSRYAPPAAGAAAPSAAVPSAAAGASAAPAAGAAAGAGWGAASQGLAGSAADRLAGPDPDAPVPSRSSRQAPPATSGSERDPVPRSRDQVRRPSAEDPSELFGPAWEQPGRYEAYPSLRTRVGLPSMGGGIPRLGVAIIALVLAAVVLFFVGPILLGIDGGGPRIATDATPGATIAAATPTPAVTAVPAPTPQLYVVAQGDTMSKIAKRFGVTVEQLLLANPQVTNPNKIAIGDELTIPVPELDSVPDAGDASTTP